MNIVSIFKLSAFLLYLTQTLAWAASQLMQSEVIIILSCWSLINALMAKWVLAITLPKLSSLLLNNLMIIFFTFNFFFFKNIRQIKFNSEFAGCCIILVAENQNILTCFWCKGDCSSKSLCTRPFHCWLLSCSLSLPSS